MGLTEDDRRHLERCLELAERGARTAAPNPLVGCVVVRDGATLGEGWHERPGSDHAEVAALRAAGDARGATAYVSLEPCSHHGRTPPCTDALLDAGVARVVVASDDPSAKASGRGIALLREAGVAVDVAGGDIALRARRQNAAFRTHALLGRPHVTYKAAASLDGRTATSAGESRWISSAESRRLVHELRARSGAVAVGIRTALADDPVLTARDVDPPAPRQPLRVVFDRDARLPVSSRLFQEAGGGPVVVVCLPGAPGRGRLADAGVETLAADSAAEALAELGGRGITSLLVEGGARLAGSLLGASLLDRILLFQAPVLMGDGPGLLASFSPPTLADAPRLANLSVRRVGPDILVEADLRSV